MALSLTLALVLMVLALLTSLVFPLALHTIAYISYAHGTI